MSVTPVRPSEPARAERTPEEHVEPRRIVFNDRRVRRLADRGPASLGRPIDFHRTLPGYAPTPLVRLDDLAREWGVAGAVVKNEQRRLGLPSYKVLGSSWALHETIRERLGLPEGTITPFAELRALARRLGPATLCTATDGNHGRGVAAMAEALGLGCMVFVHADTVPERVSAIASHGAVVRRVAGTYDDALAAAEAAAAEYGYWLCPDTTTSSAPSAARGAAFAARVGQGYETLFLELAEQLPGEVPDVLFVQAGVGALAATAVRLVRRVWAAARVVSVEPRGSHCVQASLDAGEPVRVADRYTIMAGLRCQTVSAGAWPILRDGLDAAVAIPDGRAREAMRVLARYGVEAGESGAAGLGGLLEVVGDSDLRSRLGIDSGTVIGLLNTEGATDHAAYRAIVGAPADGGATAPSPPWRPEP